MKLSEARQQDAKQLEQTLSAPWLDVDPELRDAVDSGIRAAKRVGGGHFGFSYSSYATYDVSFKDGSKARLTIEGSPDGVGVSLIRWWKKNPRKPKIRIKWGRVVKGKYSYPDDDVEFDVLRFVDGEWVATGFVVGEKQCVTWSVMSSADRFAIGSYTAEVWDLNKPDEIGIAAGATIKVAALEKEIRLGRRTSTADRQKHRAQKGLPRNGTWVVLRTPAEAKRDLKAAIIRVLESWE